MKRRAESSPYPEARPTGTMRDAAAAWVVCEDRGLSEHEAGDFARWLKADARHWTALAEARRDWTRLDKISADTVALPKRGHGWRWKWAGAGLVAALAVAGFFAFRPAAPAGLEPGRPHYTAENGGLRVMTLKDGSTIYLNAGARVETAYTEQERGIRLLRGEAHFVVTKNPQWPFVVRAGSAEIRAVGTAFNVNLGPAGVEVLVTEGRVHVAPEPARAETGPGGVPPDAPLLEAGQRAVVRLPSAGVGGRSRGPRAATRCDHRHHAGAGADRQLSGLAEPAFADGRQHPGHGGGALCRADRAAGGHR